MKIRNMKYEDILRTHSLNIASRRSVSKFLCERKANEKTFLYSWMCVAAFFAQTLPHAISPYRLNEINLSHQTNAYREFLAATTTESTLAAKWSAQKKTVFHVKFKLLPLFRLFYSRFFHYIVMVLLCAFFSAIAPLR